MEKALSEKEEGGLGFHDIGRFNQAILGKQAWRIWSQPNFLLAQVYKSSERHIRAYIPILCGSERSDVAQGTHFCGSGEHITTMKPQASMSLDHSVLTPPHFMFDHVL